jgi:hypothetical protein
VGSIPAKINRKTSINLDRIARKKRRAEIAARIGELQDQECAGCEHRSKNNRGNDCDTCPAFQEMNRLGKELDELSINGPILKEQKKAQERRDRLAILTKFDFELIQILKGEGFTLTEMANQLKMPYEQFCLKRKEIMRRHRVKNKIAKDAAEEKTAPATNEKDEKQILKKQHREEMRKMKREMDELIRENDRMVRMIEMLQEENERIKPLEDLLTYYIKEGQK